MLLFKTLPTTEEEQQLESKFIQVRKIREQNKKDLPKMKLTLSKGTFSNPLIAAKAVLVAEQQAKELKKESGFKRSLAQPRRKREELSDDEEQNPAKKLKTDNDNENEMEQNSNVAEEENVVCVTDLPDCSEENLYNFFQNFGPIKSLIPYFQTPEKYAIIHYETVLAADNAVEQMEKNPYFEGTEVQVYKPNLEGY